MVADDDAPRFRWSSIFGYDQEQLVSNDGKLPGGRAGAH